MSLRILLVYLGFLVVSVLLITSQIARLANDPGLGWHLRSGIEMIANGAVPRFDSYLALEPAPKWIADQWLGSTILAGLFVSFGWPALYTGTSLAFLLGFSVICFFALTAYTQKPIASMIATFLCLQLGLLQFLIRPVVLSLVCFVIFISWLNFAVDRIRDGRSLTLWDWIGCALLLLVWAQIHPYFVLFGISFGLIAFGFLLERFVEQRQPLLPSQWIALFIFPAVLMALTLVHPYGYELHERILFLGQSPFLTNLMQEWRPLSFDSPAGWVFQIAILLAVIGYARRVREEQRYFLPEAMLALGYIHFAVESVRAVPLAMIVLAPWMVRGISGLGQLEWLTEFPLLKKLQGYAELDERRVATVPMIAFGVGFLALYGALLFARVVPGLPEKLGPSSEKYPYGAVEFLKSLEVEGQEPLRILNNLDWGGFIEFHLRSKGKPLFDDRLTLREEQVYKDYREKFSKGKAIREFIRDQNADLLFIQTESMEHRLLSPIDEPLYEDSLAVIYRLPLQDSGEPIVPAEPVGDPS